MKEYFDPVFSDDIFDGLLIDVGYLFGFQGGHRGAAPAYLGAEPAPEAQRHGQE